MKPLDELRNISDGCAYNEDDCRQWRSCREHRAQLLDAIEREIAERYMELPLDADGVPWHIGDVTENGVVVNAMELDQHGWIFLCKNDIDPSIHRHHKPDTWERIINDAFGSTTMSDEIRASFVARCKALAGEGE